MKIVNAVMHINHNKIKLFFKVGMNMAFGLDVKNYNFSVRWSNTNLKGVRGRWVLYAVPRWFKCIKTQ
jgi:hypothetical protein